MPDLPRLMPSGAYDPVSLLEFFVTHHKEPPYRLAEWLKVPQHRVAYFMGDGFSVLRQRALQMEALRAARVSS